MVITHKRTMFPVLTAVGAAVVVCSVGCATTNRNPYITQHLDNLNRTVTMIETREAEQPKKLDRLWARIAEQHERDLAQMEKLDGVLERLMQQEIVGWERNRPTYERRIHEMSKGNIDNIERTLPKLLY